MADINQVSDVFIDESSQTKHRYLVLGGVIVPASQTNALSVGLMNARLPQLPAGEAKWTKVSRTKINAYRRLVDFFFSPEAGDCHFHSLVVDTHRIDHVKFNDGDKEIGFNKEVYQLAMKFGRLYPDRLFHIYPDYRDTNQNPDDLRLILNRGTNKKGDGRDWPYRRCHFRRSHDCLPLQLTDILIGAIAYHINGHHEAANASAAKLELMRHVMDRAQIQTPARDTNVGGKFTIWHRQLR